MSLQTWRSMSLAGEGSTVTTPLKCITVNLILLSSLKIPFCVQCRCENIASYLSWYVKNQIAYTIHIGIKQCSLSAPSINRIVNLNHTVCDSVNATYTLIKGE